LTPAVFILGAIAVMTAYPLTEDTLREIVREVAERRADQRVQQAP
jgi:Na+/melibiose symporter-like transporter